MHDPWRPAESGGGHLGPNPGYFNRKTIDERLDVGVFQTKSFEENKKFLGTPILQASVKCDRSSFDICLALSLVSENEAIANQFSTGFLRVKDAPINKKNDYKISMHPTNISIIKGTKLRLSISAAAYPAISVNPGSEIKKDGPPSINHKIITLNFDLSNTFMKMTPIFD